MISEEQIVTIIVKGGETRSKALEALRNYKRGNKEEAEKLFREANEAKAEAHKIQTQIIQEETRGTKTEVSLLMVHAQDHLMNAITICDLVRELMVEE